MPKTCSKFSFAKPTRKYQLLFKFAFFACLIAIEFLATTSRCIAVIENMWDKSNHILAFATLYLLLNFGWQSRFYVKFYIKFYILLAIGVQIELTQALLPNRYFSLLDIVADCVGIGLGAAIAKILSSNFATANFHDQPFGKTTEKARQEK